MREASAQAKKLALLCKRRRAARSVFRLAPKGAAGSTPTAKHTTSKDTYLHAK